MNRATVAGPASDEMIDDAESKLSLQFPSEYRAFLKEYGAAMRTGFEIAGIFADDDDGAPMWRQIVQATQRLRKSVNGMLPESLIPMMDVVWRTTSTLQSATRTVAMSSLTVPALTAKPWLEVSKNSS
jgi:hypothetical protein